MSHSTCYYHVVLFKPTIAFLKYHPFHVISVSLSIYKYIFVAVVKLLPVNFTFSILHGSPLIMIEAMCFCFFSKMIIFDESEYFVDAGFCYNLLKNTEPCFIMYLSYLWINFWHKLYLRYWILSLSVLVMWICLLWKMYWAD